MRSILVLALVLLAACAACADSDAPPAQPQSAGSMGDSALASVGGVAWGTPLNGLIAARGEPVFRNQVEEGVTLLGYPAVLFGHQVQLLYFVHPRDGMFRGGYMLEAANPQQCADALQLFDQALQREHPSLTAEEQHVGASDAPPCEVYFERRGSYLKKRTDPATGNRVIISLLPNNPAVVVTYTTPAADQWEERKGTGRP